MAWQHGPWCLHPLRTSKGWAFQWWNREWTAANLCEQLQGDQEQGPVPPAESAALALPRTPLLCSGVASSAGPFLVRSSFFLIPLWHLLKWPQALSEPSSFSKRHVIFLLQTARDQNGGDLRHQREPWANPCLFQCQLSAVSLCLLPINTFTWTTCCLISSGITSVLQGFLKPHNRYSGSSSLIDNILLIYQMKKWLNDASQNLLTYPQNTH